MEINIVERSTTLGPVETTVITVETGMVGPQGPPNTDASLLTTGTVDNARLDAFLQALVAIGATGGTGALARLISPTFTTPNIGVATGASLNLTGTLTASGNIVANGVESSGNIQGRVRLGSGTAGIYATGGGNTIVDGGNGSPSLLVNETSLSMWGDRLIKWANTSWVGGLLQSATYATSLGRSVDGTLQVGNGGANALGSLACANVTASGTIAGLVTSGTSAIGVNTKVGLYGGASDGIAYFADWSTGTTFSRLGFGGITSAYPAIKRSGTTVAFRLGDDSADGPISCSNVTASGTLNGMTVDRGLSATRIRLMESAARGIDIQSNSDSLFRVSYQGSTFPLVVNSTSTSITGNVAITTADGYTGNLLIQAPSGTRDYIKLTTNAYEQYIDGGGANSSLTFRLNGGLDQVMKFVASTNNVLIGSATDNGAKLQVTGNVTASGKLVVGNSGAFTSKVSLGSTAVGIANRIAVYEASDGTYFRGIGMAAASNFFGLGFYGGPGAVPTDLNAEMYLTPSGNLLLGTTTEVIGTRLLLGGIYGNLTAQGTGTHTFGTTNVVSMGSVNAGSLEAVSVFNLKQLNGSNNLVQLNANGVAVRNTSYIGWGSSASEAGGTTSASLTQSGGVVSVNTTTAGNALGSLACANVLVGNGTAALPSLAIGATNSGFYTGNPATSIRSVVNGNTYFGFGIGFVDVVGYMGLTTASPGAGISDVRWYRGATGPTFDACAAGGFRSRDLANTADAPISCSNVTASGTGTFSNGITVSGSSSQGRIQTAGVDSLYLYSNSGQIYFHDGNTVARMTAGVFQFGTRSLTQVVDITASGTVTASSTGTHTFGTTNTVTLTAGAIAAAQGTGTPTLNIANPGNSGPDACARIGTASAGLWVAGFNYATRCTAGNATTVPLTSRGFASQTANLFDCQNSAGTNMFSVTSGTASGVTLQMFSNGGTFEITTSGNLATLGGNHDLSFNGVYASRINAGNALMLRVRGGASQTSNLQEWQNSAGTVLASVSSLGYINTSSNINIISGGNVQATTSLYAGQLIQFGVPGTATYTFLDGRTDGNLILSNNASTGFGRLQFGGITSSFPSLKRNAAGFDIRVADDTAYSDLTLRYLNVAGGGAVTLSSGTNIQPNGDGGLFVQNSSNVPRLTINSSGDATALGMVQGSSLRVANSNGQIDLSSTTINFTNATAIRVGSTLTLKTTGAFRNSTDSADADISAANITSTGIIKEGSYTVAGLPSAASSTRGRAYVTDSTLTYIPASIGSTVTGGGANLVPVWSNGTNWVIG